MGKLVSIVVLTYNRFNTLEDTLRSIKDQDYDNYEVIINDNGSTNYSYDSVKEIVDRVGLERVTIGTNGCNLGIIKNINIAFKKASGSYILRLDPDDTFTDSHVVSDIVKFFEDTGCLLCAGKRKGTLTHRVLPGPSDSVLFQRADAHEELVREFYESVIYGAVLYASRELFDRIGFWDEEYYMLDDLTYIIKALLNDIPVNLMDRITINYGESGTSNSNVGLKQFSPEWDRKDLKLLHTKVIQPNLHLVEKKWARRRIRFTYEMVCTEAKLPRVLLCCLKNFPTGVLIALGKVIGKICKDEGMEYRLLTGTLFRK